MPCLTDKTRSKQIYKILTAHIIVNGEKVDTFYLRLGREQESPLPLLILKTVLKVLANTVR